MMEESLDFEIDVSGLKNLIRLKRGMTNSFSATIEPFELEYQGEWEETNAVLKEIMKITFNDHGIEVDVSSTSYEKIGGINFEAYTFSIVAPDNPDFIIGYQTMYSQLVNGYDFGVIITTTDTENRDEILKAFRKSKFREK